jgi:hypothetical protein
MSDVFSRVTEYEVSVFPDELRDSDDMLTAEEAHTWVVTVAWRGQGKWAVIYGHGGSRTVLGSDGEWDYEPCPSSREDDWLATHRFDLETALRLAAGQAPKVTINGRTALDILAKLQARAARK